MAVSKEKKPPTVAANLSRLLRELRNLVKRLPPPKGTAVVTGLAACFMLTAHSSLLTAQPPAALRVTVTPAKQLDAKEILLFIDVDLGDSPPRTLLRGILTIEGSGVFIPTYQREITIQRKEPFAKTVRELIAVRAEEAPGPIRSMLLYGPRTARLQVR
jgi:hypothetical protein